ncbi:hypothetical protein JCM8547_008732 [Rhodosporidiobolus lusitaniae]
MFTSILGSLASATGSASSPAAEESASSLPSSSSTSSFSTPSPPPPLAEPVTPPPQPSTPSATVSADSPFTDITPPDLEDLALDTNPCFEYSAYFQRLLKRGGHHPNRIRQIKRQALRGEPPVEPKPWECCGGGCGIDCVVTIWWEEEKTWRDMHPDWKDIKKRLKEEEEDRQRAAEEEAALNGSSGQPEVAIEAEKEEDGTRTLEAGVKKLKVET